MISHISIYLHPQKFPIITIISPLLHHLCFSSILQCMHVKIECNATEIDINHFFILLHFTDIDLNSKEFFENL